MDHVMNLAFHLHMATDLWAVCQVKDDLCRARLGAIFLLSHCIVLGWRTSKRYCEYGKGLFRFTVKPCLYIDGQS